MESLYIPATASSPEIRFDFDRHALSMRGESYPENAAAFYGPLIAQLRAYLEGCRNDSVTMDIALAYFNSSSTKMLFNIFEALNGAARAGNTVVVNWFHDEEDDTILEFGQELSDDFTSIRFVDQPVKSA
ncbi:MAG: DUF1987 domain-containing protein [Candidatus Dactylopiibacterium sp.]|nr:DUF1987 domain-containing protein [Candidatus Dactylopiibacterium sp.]